MKRMITRAFSPVLLLSLVICGTQVSASETQGNDINQQEQGSGVDETTDSLFLIDVEGITTFDELEDCIEEHLSNTIESLVLRWETLSAEIDTYEKYCENSEMVSDFYQTVVSETEQMCIMFFEYSAAYAQMILVADMADDDKYDAIDGINDCLYDDACDEIHDEIYEGILDDMHDYFYEGILGR